MNSFIEETLKEFDELVVREPILPEAKQAMDDAYGKKMSDTLEIELSAGFTTAKNIAERFLKQKLLELQQREELLISELEQFASELPEESPQWSNLQSIILKHTHNKKGQ